MRTVLAALIPALASGCAAGLVPFRGAGSDVPQVRFVTREDLGLGPERINLNVIFTLHPRVRLDSASIRWLRPDQDRGFDLGGAFHALARNVLSEVFLSAVETPPGLYTRIEDVRRALPAGEGITRQLPALGAKALVLVDFRPPLAERPGLAAQLLVQVYDISFPRYEEVSLFSPRLLIFEDAAEVPAVDGPRRLPGALVGAWREVLARMRASDRFQRYLALGPEPLSNTEPAGAFLLGLIPPERMPRIADPRGHEWIERTILFPPAAAAPPAPGPRFSGEPGVPAAPPHRDPAPQEKGTGGRTADPSEPR